MSTASEPLKAHRWLLIPALLCLLATFLLGTPIQVFGLRLPEPVFPMILPFAWAVIRPSILAPFALLAIGVFLDLFWSGPLGLWGLSLLLVYGAVLVTRNLILGQGVPVMAAWYVGAVVLAFVMAYLFVMLDAKTTPDLLATFWQLAVTAALFPLAQRLIERFEDADIRFR